MASPMTTPRDGSLLSRMFRKKEKKHKNKRKNKANNIHEKNNSSDINEEDNDENDNDNENENENENGNKNKDENVNGQENENSELSNEKDLENSMSQTENGQISEEFDEKSIYQEPTFVINHAPVHKTMKTFKLMLAITENFGLTVEEMITILDAAAPASKLVRKLKEFLEIKMPSGFPVQLELPLYHILKATVTFQNFKEMEVTDDVFLIPQDYLLVEKDNVSRLEDDN